MGGSRQTRRRRNGQPTPLELLLGDPGTVHAAVGAFALAERPDEAAWPFVASVGLQSVTLRWAGGTAAAVPEPEAPWRAGHDARVWIADRAELGSGPVGAVAAGGAALVIGQFAETVVFVNTSRAPGPIAVDGAKDGAAGLLREVIRRQTAQDSEPGDTPRGAWWPIEVEDDAIILLGLAIARMFTPDEARMACELMQSAASQRPEPSRQQPQRQPVVVGRDVETVQAVENRDVEYVEKWRKLGYVEEELATPHALPTSGTADAGLDDWLRQVKAAAASAQAPTTTELALPTPDTASAAMDAGASAPVSTPAPSPMPAVSAAAAPQPASPALKTSPSPADDDLDDWAAGFAVSSAEESARR